MSDYQFTRGFTADEMNQLRRVASEGGSVEEAIDGIIKSQFPPLLQVIMDEFKARGWRIESSDGKVVYWSPENRPWGSLDEAVFCQSMREMSEDVFNTALPPHLPPEGPRD